MTMFTPLTISAATFSLFAKYAYGQLGTTTVNCTTQVWNNQHGQPPCIVAATLETQCQNQPFNIPALNDTSIYSGPSVEANANPCVCSTVVYSLVSACAICQGRNIQLWTQWSAHCPNNDISIAKWPLPIPPNVAIPAWAFQNVSASGTFNITMAQEIKSQNLPDSTTSSPNPASIQSGSTSKSNHAGAIAGGVVGGVVGLALILLVLFVLYKKRNAKAASDKFMPGGEKYDLTGGADRASPVHRAGSATPTLPIQSAPPKLYDPADPSTFPRSPAPTYPTYPSRSPFEGSTTSDSMYTGPGHTSPQPLMTHHASPSIQSGKYAGVPEV